MSNPRSSGFGVTNRRTENTLRILDQGALVKALHNDLRGLQFTIADDELERARFGPTTRRAVARFQRQQGLDTTGIVDQHTRKALLEAASTEATEAQRLRWRRSISTLRRTSRLGLKGREFRLADAELSNQLQSRRTTLLKRQLLELFDQPSEQLAAAIDGLAIDPDEVADLSLNDFVFTRVVPNLMDNEALQPELYKIARRGIDTEDDTIGDILGLDQDARDDDSLREVTRRARNAALGDIIGLDDDAIETLGDADLSQSSDAVFRLADAGSLREAQRDRLLFAADLARLTDDNFDAVRTLIDDGVQASRDLVSRDRRDWMRFIEANGIQPPNGDTPEIFAAVLDKNVELAFPTAYALARFTAPPPESTLARMDVLSRLPNSDGPIFSDNGVRDDIDLSFMPPSEAETIRADLADLGRFANRYAGLGVREVLNDRSLSAGRKRTLIERRQAALARAWNNRPGLDLRLANFSPLADPTARAFSVELDDVEPSERPFVRSALMSMQRTLRLSDGYAEADSLMAAGLDDAARIAELDDADELAERTGLSRPVALRIRARAIETRTRLLHVVHGIEETTGHAPFLPATLHEAETTNEPGTLINVLQSLPGYSELFGPQNYCKCSHCRSIFSPAAYFVDLMRFIDKKISRRNFINADLTDHPLYLRNRRPDLWSLPLTCENTNTPVRYLEIVNEVLTHYLDSADPLAGDVWENLATQARSSFRQPFNLPHAQMLLYLQHLGVGLNEVSSLFDAQRRAATYARFSISPQEQTTIASADALGAIYQRFAKRFRLNADNIDVPLIENMAVHDTHQLTKLTGLSREMLGRLLETGFVRGNVSVVFDITTQEPDDLTGFVEYLHLEVDGQPANVASSRALLDRLHRLTRLQRALDWTPEALQMAIDALDASQPIPPDSDPERYGEALNGDMLASLADIKQLMDRFDLPVSEAIALSYRIPDAASDPTSLSLWKQLFGDADQLTVRHPSLANTQADETEVSPGFGILQGALQISEPDLIDLLQRDLPVSVIDTGIVQREQLNRLYRSARLARVLRLSQDAFAALSRIVPNLTADVAAAARLTAIWEAIDLVDAFDRVGLSFNDLLPHLDGNRTADQDVAHATELLDQVRIKLREDERLWLTPAAISQIAGLTPESARTVLAQLLDSDNLLIQPDATRERYLVADNAALTQDDPRLLNALSVEGGPLHDPGSDDHSAPFLAEALRQQLLQHLPHTQVAVAIAGALSLSGDTLEAFDKFFDDSHPLENGDIGLTDWLRTGDGPASTTLLSYVAALIRLQRLLTETLNASDDAVRFIADRLELFAITPLALSDAAPPSDGWHWSTLWRLAEFIELLRNEKEDPAAVVDIVDGWADGLFAESTRPGLALILGVTEGQLEMLLAALPPDSDVFGALDRLKEAVRLTGRIGLDPTSLRQLTGETFQQALAAKDLVLGAIRTKHPTEEAWRNVSDRFSDHIETLKRDALVDRILSRRELRFENTRNIYHFFLLDPEMDGCFQTSRVKNAISTCQLYMQRCLMGLEKSVETGIHPPIQVKVKQGKKTREEWKWRKSYRVWEANRKVFLYPENYMLPDLRDDSTHIFKAAESDLLQGNLDNSTIEKVFQRYLAEFVEVGSIKIVHTLYEKGEYLFFGRTLQEPYRYFMRRFNGKGHWEPWEPIDLDIGAKTISAVTKNGNWYLFWTNVALNSDADKVRDAQPDVDPDELTENGAEPVNDQSQEILPITVSYSVRNESGVWSQPQDFVYYSLLQSKGDFEKNSLLPISDRIYAEFRHPSRSTEQSHSGVKHLIRLIHPVEHIPVQYLNTERDYTENVGFLREFDNRTIRRDGEFTNPKGSPSPIGDSTEFSTSGLQLGESWLWRVPEIKSSSSTAKLDYIVNGNFKQKNPGFDYGDVIFFEKSARSSISLKTVQRSTSESVLDVSDDQYLIKLTGQPGLDQREPDSDDVNSNMWFYIQSASLAKWKLISLTTGYPSRLSQTFFREGLDQLLSPTLQNKTEPTAEQSGLSFSWIGMLRMPDEDYGYSNLEKLASGDQLHAISQFDGVHGSYLWELYFHLPFQIAHTLNSIGKFEEADRWYRYIFDPTTADSKPNAHWRFVVFRTLNLPKLRELLADRKAIRKYKTDPFNPYAIARLRPSAFQKTIVMRYIDNLLDWGDERFRIDTRESNNEAMLLYTMAADLLGERPIETGECELAEEGFTFNDIQQRGSGNHFLIELENLVYFYVNLGTRFPVNASDPDLDFAIPTFAGVGASEPGEPPAVGSAFTTRANAVRRLGPYAEVRQRAMAMLALNPGENDSVGSSATSDIAFQPDLPPDPDPPFEPTYDFVADDADDADIDGPVFESRSLAFCVPPNDTLLEYWDRVEDRLYKLRHCMNIEGVVGELPLWQPAIDPMLLVRAKAAGLELDDVLVLINEQPPHHRFEVLMERARRFTATAQQFGNQLLSALERKDESELTLLRSVHEDTILNLVRRQKLDAIAEAKASRDHLDTMEHPIRKRFEHYLSLLASDRAFSISEKEQKALQDLDEVQAWRQFASQAESKALSHRQGPQWSSSLSSSVGGGISFSSAGLVVTAIGTASIGYGAANLEAKYQRRALRDRDRGSRSEAAASATSTNSSYERRQEEWYLQRAIAELELNALTQQKTVADIRIALAEKDLETHDQQIDNSRELYDFAKDRFTNLGLYSYLSTTLSRLYREAYDMALKMAQTAERAYRFEIGEDTFFVKLDNWTASRAGLLAADRLLLQLQAMEAAFIERDRRRQEVTLPCALSQIDPDALLSLRHLGRARISIPEWWLDLHYPGQYRRMLSTVRLTIPCVSGPYNNVAAKLTLVDSAIRTTANPADDALVGVQIGRNTSISTSSAKSDTGVFELRFDGPKNPPFKGAGAVSTWVLELPDRHRVFDYGSIADAILELSYTAEDDGLLRAAVMGGGDNGQPGRVDAALQDGMVRIVSLRHELPDVFHSLMTTNNATGAIDIPLTRARLFPHWVGDRDISVRLEVLLEPQPSQQIRTEEVQGIATATINGESISSWFPFSSVDSIPAAAMTDELQIEADGTAVTLEMSLPETLEVRDILLRLTYTAPTH
ncbi:Peptidoglycan-binding domain 1 protein [Thiorhodococcus drewsii AZ1]|uniref:Peptidoglycan-binding domain 1 protein n=1 Tax=Thiorhodococcus drewsii AZ1 TaxID=765913 RepID=G2E4H0_9GAMM|nr:neuraminidase-like domain-containing protein [Thiorhodococcus drewsii]EGV29591.1 Peptidoglycan-binding domain 1 protein [Thiorhodococcus drewsii AZ1]